MCGIAGAIGHVDEEILAALRSASERQRHRGPDADGFFASELEAGRGAALAFRRLAIIDLSPDGNQPMVDPQTGAALVFNGEIYNFRELRTELEREGVRFHSRGDSEVLLQSWVRWGRDCLSRLRGMFAFGVFDPRRRCLFLARDRLGIKPLYLARARRPGGRETLLFASELRALLASDLVERRLAPAALGSFLWNGFVAGPDTIVAGVRRLAPGSWLEIGLDDLSEREERYWHLPLSAPSPSGRAELAEELERAVRMRLVADVPLGIFLSGGIDSSAVTALAVRAATGSVRTFNIRFPDSELDESRYARAIAQRLGTDHREVPLSEIDFKSHLTDALSSIDQPTFDAINTYFVSRAVREAGITVALAGTGGDELFGGYPSFRELPRMRLASRVAGALPRPLRRALAQAIVRARLGPAGEVPPQTRWGKLADVLDQRGNLLELYQLAYGLFVPDFLRGLSPLAARAATRSGLDPQRAADLERWLERQPVLHAISGLELACFIGERLLPDTDAASMAVSLEARVPLLDHRVVEAAATVEPRERFEPLGRKRLLRELALGDLDPALFDRPKQGFELPLGEWVRRELRDDVGARLNDRAACLAAGLDPDVTARLWRAFQAGAPGMYWSRVWSLFVLVDWCARQRVSA